MTFDARRLYFVLLAVVGVAVLALFGSVYVAGGLLKAKSKDVAKARLDSLVLEQKQVQLNKARADIEKYQALADIAKHIVPQDKDQAQTVREIVSIGAASGIKLGAITFPTSSLGDPKTPHSQLTPVKNIAGVYSLDITVQSDTSSPSSFASFIDFLDRLEHNRRTALVKGISIQPDASNPSRLSFTLTLSEYIKP